MAESDICIDARAKAIACRSAWWGYRPCQPGGTCPFGRKTPQKPSDPHCTDVTVEMWAEVLKETEEDNDVR